MSGRYSYAVRALLIILLERRPADWTQVTQMAGPLALGTDDVRMHLETMASEGTVQVRRALVATGVGPIMAAMLPGEAAPVGAQEAPLLPAPAGGAPWNAVNGPAGGFQGEGTAEVSA